MFTEVFGKEPVRDAQWNSRALEVDMGSINEHGQVHGKLTIASRDGIWAQAEVLFSTPHKWVRVPIKE